MLIVGTGGLGKEIFGILVQDGFPDEIVFYDEDPYAPVLLYQKYKVLQDINAVQEYFRGSDKRFITGIGHPRIREKLTLKMEGAGGILSSVISEKASIFHFNEKYSGVIVQQGVGISHNVIMGKGVAVHINASIGHSAVIGNFVNIGPNTTVIGPVKIGDYSYISAHAVVMPRIKIGKCVVVTPGKIVDRDLKDFTTY